MKLTDATLYVRINARGGYDVRLVANDGHSNVLECRNRAMSFEIPAGPRPILQDLGTILRMVGEELSR